MLNNWTVNKDSYAQHGEDKLIELLLPEGVNTFIDIGANDGVCSQILINLLNKEQMAYALNRPQCL